VGALKFDVAMRTDRGVVREANQDAVAGEPEAGLVVLADGMGGANAGEVASGLAVDLLMKQLVAMRESTAQSVTRDELLEALHSVNSAIHDLAQQVPEYHGMGTTLVMGLLREDHLIYAHVGDSRLYRMHQGEFQALTCDHTLLQELVDLGEFSSLDEALDAGVPKNVLSRAFGVEKAVEADIAELALSAGDLLLLCSDGLTNMLADNEIAGILHAKDMDLMARVDALIAAACENGGADNISVILVRVINSDET